MNKEISGGRNALHFAADYGQTDVIQCLIDHGADVNVSQTVEQTVWVLDDNLGIIFLFFFFSIKSYVVGTHYTPNLEEVVGEYIAFRLCVCLCHAF